MLKTAQQKAVFVATYLDTGKVSVSAKKAGIRRETAYSWLNNDPAIQGLIQESQQALYLQALNQLNNKVTKAGDYLISLLEDQTASNKDKLTAVRMILDQAEKIAKFNRVQIQNRNIPVQDNPIDNITDSLYQYKESEDKQNVNALIKQVNKLESKNSTD
ncbi:hypothetical protein [Oenococcus oeni]|uniref:hypothetical protein n=6 Tax=Oenococcus oeni TaxID=1247 RepID=UPI00050EC948|nr:hypothetical protein [Oenococcus oeni]KGH56174.1 hypothetical protein X463_03300 [Oenococcus oeni S22]KGI01380.1 hypothetical protein X293_06740 [Oenococcus oeni IOEB_C52]KGI06159.1 hypothetical protein X297_04215 [Oenococcus oeni IOEB_L40_4]KMQ38901.1 hypothetical protein AAX20_01660 [Oenococcus oeni]MDV7686786.1 hypothetical protein [Oenococcus oeni]